jgi:hypothetical protein
MAHCHIPEGLNQSVYMFLEFVSQFIAFVHSSVEPHC